MKILLDNGHGKETAGKRSPDGRLKEWQWTREIAKMLEERLIGLGYDAERIVPEDNDVYLGERCRRVNAVCDKVGIKNVCLVSIHVNAVGKGDRWYKISGFSSHIYKYAGNKSRQLAQMLFNEAEASGLKGTLNTPVDRYWASDFYILKKTKCCAVLTENLFQDNMSDVDFLLSDQGKNVIVNIHLKAIINYIKTV